MKPKGSLLYFLDTTWLWTIQVCCNYWGLSASYNETIH